MSSDHQIFPGGPVDPLNGGVVQFLRPSVKHNFSLGQADDPGGILQGHIQLVEVDDAGDVPLLGHTLEQIHDGLGAGGVQRGNGLVAQQELWPLHDGPCDPHTLLLTAGQVAGPVVGELLQPQLFQKVQSLLLVLLAVPAEHALDPAHIAQAAVEHVLQDG